MIVASDPSRAHPAKAKREPFFLELCAEIAALSDMDEWNALSAALEGRLTAFPLGWADVFADAMEAQRIRLHENGRL